MPERELFQLMGPEIENPDEFIRNAEVEFHKALDELADLESESQARGRRLNAAEVGSIAGKAFVRYIASRYDRPDSLQEIKQEVRNALPQNVAEEFIAGFVLEYAIAHALTEQIGKDVYYSAPQEDGKQKVDWVVKEPESPGEIFIQVKTISAIDPNLKKLCFSVETNHDIQKMANELYSLKYKGQPSIGNYVRQAEEMLKANQNNDSRLVFIFIPSDEINPYSGTLTNKDLIVELDNFFAEL